MTWPVVTIVLILAASVVGLFWMSTPEGRSTILAFLIASCTSVLAVVIQSFKVRYERDRRRRRHLDEEDRR